MASDQKAGGNDIDVFEGMSALTTCLSNIDSCPNDEGPADSYPTKRQIREILREVYEGKLKPAAADEWAEGRGFGSFSQNPRTIDIFASYYILWSLEMFAAWITWRRVDLVMRQAPEVYEGSVIWVKNPSVPIRRQPFGSPPPVIPKNGFTLENLGPTSIFESFIAQDGKRYSFPPSIWQRQMFDRLMLKQVAAIGTDELGTTDSMPVTVWDRGQFQLIGGRTVLISGDKQFTNLRFGTADIKVAVPALPGPEIRDWKTERPPSASDAESFLLEKLLNRSSVGFEPLPDKELLDIHKDMIAIFKISKNHDSFRRYLDRFLNKFCEPKRQKRP
ncbi:hypothetical protein B5K08_05420 [Rhizobium leguminosarum bv. trifolii]|uniref:Uncharacterized protein n=1 Tax=Rhizobium leguminosarum bv. trifolii TaxID=386 RepID=A0A3E1BYA1_RHILT|nr:hypothetical protein [Rhizobium leguminosarum]RFB97989.1 hypothetical protein B5K08_05420 [Rhizobium leguminosarum bv. trifolii]RFB99942.1 hypothetical protein B5K10_05410 [Rhizobium leguminosarum bv. trifolii]